MQYPECAATCKGKGSQILLTEFTSALAFNKVFNGVNKIYSYAEALSAMAGIEPETYENLIPNILVGFDNSPRRGEHGIILTDNSPELFRQEFLRVIKKLKNGPGNYGMIFINAWNEWAEGNHLEPDRRYGHAFLEATQRALTQAACS